MKKITLQAESLTFVLNFERQERAQGKILLSTELHLNKKDLKESLYSVKVWESYKDLLKFILYLKMHMCDLKEDENSIAPPFETQGQSFRVIALTGDFDYKNEWYFAIHFAVNVGKDENGADIFEGFKNYVWFNDVDDFLEELRLFIINEQAYYL